MNIVKNMVKKSVSIWFTIVIIVVLLMTSVAGMQIYVLTIEHVSLFGGQIQSSEFTIISEKTSFHGLNKIVVKLTLSNMDSTNAHSANVTIFLLNSAGNALYNESYLTGIVPASGTVSNTTVFFETDITTAYSSTFVQVMDVS